MKSSILRHFVDKKLLNDGQIHFTQFTPFFSVMSMSHELMT